MTILSFLNQKGSGRLARGHHQPDCGQLRTEVPLGQSLPLFEKIAI